jgi:hypothetical protein
MGKEYIPKNDAKFDAWFNHLVEYVLARVLAAAPVWTHIPKAEAEKLAASCTAWHTAYETVIGPHTPVETEAKNNVKKAAVKGIRLFVNQYLRFSAIRRSRIAWSFAQYRIRAKLPSSTRSVEPVTNEDRTAMGIPNKDTHPTPVPEPEDFPEVDVQMPLPRVLHFRFRRANMKRWGKPVQRLRR